ncbi:hypothetical protein [Dysosmobacter sp.]
MKLEKRSSGEGDTPQPQENAPGKKPVVVYIMILFIVAFLLMALSFFMHQRSNTEALGQLQNSVTAMQEVQAVQDKVIALQEELAQAEEQVNELNDQLSQQADDTAAAQKETDAMLALYTLQQQYAAGDYDACLETLQHMEDEKLVDLLPKEDSAVTAPAQRYQQLKEAVLNH